MLKYYSKGTSIGKFNKKAIVLVLFESQICLSSPGSIEKLINKQHKVQKEIKSVERKLKRAQTEAKSLKKQKGRIN